MRKHNDPWLLFLVGLTLLLVFLITLRTPNDADLWWHLSAGRAMWNRREILIHDIFSYTRAGQPWTNAFWISELILFWLYEIGGFFAITLFVSGMAALTMAVVFKHAKSPLPFRVGVVILATLALAPIWTPRPQLASFLIVAGLDYFLSNKAESLKKPFWMLIPLFALWPNFHGGFIFGFLLLAAFLGGKLLEPLFQRLEHWRLHYKKIRILMVCVIISAFAVGLNPNGLAIWKLPFYTVDVSLAIQEWHSPDFHRLDFHPVLWLLFMVILGLGFSKKKISLFDLFKTLGFAYMTFYSQRSMALFAIVAAPVAARYLTSAWEGLDESPLRWWIARIQQKSSSKPLPSMVTATVNGMILVLVGGASLVRAHALSDPEAVYQSYPKAAVAWIEENRPDAWMFNSYNWGGYLTWDLDDYPVFIDGRADLYGDEIIGQWWQMIDATDEGIALLDVWNIQFVLVEPHWPVVAALENQDWAILFQDDVSIILGRE